MIEGAGVVRSAESLSRAGRAVDAIGAAAGTAPPVDRAHGELANLVTAAQGVLRSATVRCETRGAHARSDFPEPSDAWRRRIVHTGAGVSVLDGPATLDARAGRPDAADAGEAGRERSPSDRRWWAPAARAVVDAVARALAEDLLPLGDLTSALVPCGPPGRCGS